MDSVPQVTRAPLALTVAVLVVGLLGTVAACQVQHTTRIGRTDRPSERLHIGSRVVLPTGTVSAVGNGTVDVRIRVRETGTVKEDVVTVVCDPALLQAAP